MAAPGPSVPTPRPPAATAAGAAPVAPAQNMSIPRPVVWTFEEDCRLENALAQHWANVNKLQLVASLLPHKGINAVRRRFAILEQDIANIEAGRVPLPAYPGSAEPLQIQTAGKKKFSTPAPDERRKGVPWSEEEHRLFLQGLEIYGKGDWRSISRKCVLTRNPTQEEGGQTVLCEVQVASHAQKYFIRLNSMNRKDKRRSSIHDITTPAGAAGAHAPGMAAMQQGHPHPHPGAAMMAPGHPHAMAMGVPRPPPAAR